MGSGPWVAWATCPGRVGVAGRGAGGGLGGGVGGRAGVPCAECGRHAQPTPAAQLSPACPGPAVHHRARGRGAAPAAPQAARGYSRGLGSGGRSRRV